MGWSLGRFPLTRAFSLAISRGTTSVVERLELCFDHDRSLLREVASMLQARTQETGVAHALQVDATGGLDCAAGQRDAIKPYGC